jgi:hypothetical protein
MEILSIFGSVDNEIVAIVEIHSMEYSSLSEVIREIVVYRYIYVMIDSWLHRLAQVLNQKSEHKIKIFFLRRAFSRQKQVSFPSTA